MSWRWPAAGVGGGGGGASAKAAALQALVSASGVAAKAAWALLRNNDGTLQHEDRTGNGYDMATPATIAYTADLIPGNAAMCQAIYPITVRSLVQTLTAPSPVMLGNVSWTGRMQRMQATLAGLDWRYFCGNFSTPVPPTFAVCGSFGSGNPDRLTAFWKPGNAFDVIPQPPTLKLAADGQWTFVAMVRKLVVATPTLCTVRFALGTKAGIAFEDAPGTYPAPLAADGVANQGIASIGQCGGLSGAGDYNYGPTADQVLWDGALTDADVTALYKTAMGV